MAQQMGNPCRLKEAAGKIIENWDKSWLGDIDNISEILSGAGQYLGSLNKSYLKNVKEYLKTLDDTDKYVLWLRGFLNSVIEQTRETANQLSEMHEEMNDRGSPKWKDFGAALPRLQSQLWTDTKKLDWDIGEYRPKNIDREQDPHNLWSLYWDIEEVSRSIIVISVQAEIVCRDYPKG